MQAIKTAVLFLLAVALFSCARTESKPLPNAQPEPPFGAAKLAGKVKQLNVRVTWKDTGRPIEGVVLTAKQHWEKNFPIVSDAVTDANGAATILFPGQWNDVFVFARHPQIIPTHRMAHVPPDTTVTFQADRGAVIYGQVSYEDRRPAPGACVWLAEDADFATFASPGGAYEISGLSGGWDQVIAWLGDKASNAGGRQFPMIKIQPGERIGPVNLTLHQGAQLKGRTCERETGRAIRNVRVEILGWPNPEKRRIGEIYSDSGGGLTVDGLPEGRVVLLMSAEGYANTFAIVQLESGMENFYRLALEPEIVLTVRASDESGAPVADADVGFHEDYALLSRRFRRVKTDAQGCCILKEINRRFPPHISFRKKGFLDNGIDEKYEAPIVFIPGSQKAQACATMKAAPDDASKTPAKTAAQAPAPATSATTAPGAQTRLIVFKGQVCDGAGSPVAGASVYWGYQAGFKRGDPAVTDSNGAYHLQVTKSAQDGNAKGEFRGHVLAVIAKGYVIATQDMTAGGTPQEPKEVNFTLAKGHGVDCAVFDPKGLPVAGALVELNPKCESAKWNFLHILPYEFKTYTDAYGRFRFEDYWEYEPQVTIRHRNYSSILRQSIPYDRVTSLTMPEAGVIVGRVAVAGSGTPIKAFTIKIRNHNEIGTFSNLPMIFNPDNGEFVLRRLDQGMQYNLIVEADGFACEYFNGVTPRIPAQAEPIPFNLRRQSGPGDGTFFGMKMLVFGTVSLDQKPIADAIIRFRPKKIDAQSSQYSVQTNSNGSYQIGFTDSGPFVAQISCPGAEKKREFSRDVLINAAKRYDFNLP
ncbi:MAG: hypothetical protein NTX50_12670 [Candidatus Sumerlaeota bacterium]|nr:hypothetical protein [Candidatus Sumerlaeota bacterium]